MSDVPLWMRDHLAAWERTLDVLRSEGWHVRMMTSAAPVQIDGHAPDGQLFYFRARHTDVLLAVGGDDPADSATYQAQEHHPDASHLPADDGRDCPGFG
jgi:hypothetical protein